MEITKPTFIELKNINLVVDLCTLGASIYRIKYNDVDMLVTPINKDDFSKNTIYFGKTIGRVAGRINLKDKRYNLQYNDNELSLHGGKDGLSTKEFSYKKKENSVEFTYLSEDGEAGYPGNLKIKVIYELLVDGLKVSYSCSVDKPCLLALTNHAFFCLGEKSTNELVLRINADRYIYVDENLKPIERRVSPFKFKGETFDDYDDIDNYFYLKDNHISLNGSKYKVEITSSFSGVQIYTDHYDDEIITQCSDMTCFRGVAIEPEDDQLDRKELLPNEKYERYIEYRFRKL